MKLRTVKWMLAVVGSLLIAGDLTFAQSTINHRERRQQRRIVNGVKKGELTKNEVKKLEKEQARIHRQEARAKADGEFTDKERAKIQKKQNTASRHIYKEKHDNQTRD
jgi:aminoglycoside phosphotransferase family enzyme